MIQLGKEKGINIGLVRPITLWPFPSKPIKELAETVKGILTVEMSAGQMVEDVKLAVEGRVKVEFFGRFGGMIPAPDNVFKALKQKLIEA